MFSRLSSDGGKGKDLGGGVGVIFGRYLFTFSGGAGGCCIDNANAHRRVIRKKTYIMFVLFLFLDFNISVSAKQIYQTILALSSLRIRN